MDFRKNHKFWWLDAVENIQIFVLLIWYLLKNDGLIKLLRKQVFRGRLATPVEMDLSISLTYKQVLPDLQHQFVELNIEAIRSNRVSFAVPIRGINALRKLKKGYRYFAMVRGNTVVGDIFCIVPHNKREPIVNSDLEMLGIICKLQEAYETDLFVDPSYAGKHLSAFILRSLHIKLREDGLKKLYSYHWDDNIPAVRAHRRVNYKELPKRRVSRFFFFKRFENVH